MSDSTVWWILAGLAVSAELLTGTFHLLMLAIGLAAGALAAHAGLTVVAQLVCAAVLGGGAVVWLHIRRRTQPTALPAQANADVNLDIGQTLHVALWSPEHTAQASYRGALWTVELITAPDPNAAPQPAPSTPPAPGRYQIREVVGNRLRVAPA